MISTAPGLQHICTAQPAVSQASSPDETGKPRLMNSSRDEKTRRVSPIDPLTIFNDIVSHTGGWPVNVAGELVVVNSRKELEIKKTEAQFFAWLYEYFDVDWKAAPAIAKREFFEFCRSNTKQYTGATHFPHFPAIDELLYCCPSLPEGPGQALDGFIAFFNPATDYDRELIKSFILTLFWGGPPGSRPAFLITTDDTSVNQGRGYGKTTLLGLCGELCGGLLAISQAESVETIKKRLVSLSDNQPRPRIIAIDNVKTRRFSWADLESMITAQDISGHALYRGNGSVRNHHTFAVTVNGACLAKDLAQRFVTIKLGKPNFSHSWQSDILQYIKEKRREIIRDIRECLMAPAHPLPGDGVTRFGTWEQGVLCKVNDAIQVRDLIKERQLELDDDEATQKDFHQFLFEQVDSPGLEASKTEVIPGVIQISHDQMHKFYGDFTGEKVGKNVLTKQVTRFGLRCLKCLCPKGKRRFWFFRIDGQPLTSEQLAELESLGKPKLDDEEDDF